MFLGKAALRSKPKAQERPEAFPGNDVDLTKAIRVIITSLLTLSMIDREMAIAPLL